MCICHIIKDYLLTYLLTYQLPDFSFKMHQIQFRLRLCPRPRWENLYGGRKAEALSQ